jgi:hypothetical protein
VDVDPIHHPFGLEGEGSGAESGEEVVYVPVGAPAPELPGPGRVLEPSARGVAPRPVAERRLVAGTRGFDPAGVPTGHPAPPPWGGHSFGNEARKRQRGWEQLRVAVRHDENRQHREAVAAGDRFIPVLAARGRPGRRERHAAERRACAPAQGLGSLAAVGGAGGPAPGPDAALVLGHGRPADVSSADEAAGVSDDVAGTSSLGVSSDDSEIFQADNCGPTGDFGAAAFKAERAAAAAGRAWRA